MSVGYSVHQLAEVFAITERQVKQYVDEGVFPNATKNGYDVVSCVRGLKRHLEEQQFITNAAGVADFLNLTTPAVYKMQRQGMPRIKRGKYDIRECVRWDRERWRQRAQGSLDADHDEERRKLAVAQRRKAELEVGKLERSLIPLDEYNEDLNFLAGLVVSQLSALPGRLANEVAAAQDPGQARQILYKEVQTVRQILADELTKRALALDPEVNQDTECTTGSHT
jgi:phage terminase Nu1 subunit (DNA packaging protein)